MEVNELLEYFYDELNIQPKEPLTQSSTPENLNELSSVVPGKRLHSEEGDIGEVNERSIKKYLAD